MDITDKHKLLNVVVAQASIGMLNVKSKGDTNIIGFFQPNWPARPTQDGTEVLRVKLKQSNPNMQVDGKPIVQIAFEKYGPTTKQPIIHCVTELRNSTVGTIQLFVNELRRKHAKST